MAKINATPSFTITQNGANISLSLIEDINVATTVKFSVKAEDWYVNIDNSGLSSTQVEKSVSLNAKETKNYVIPIPISLISKYPAKSTINVTVEYQALVGGAAGAWSSGSVTSVGTLDQSFAPDFSISHSQAVAAPTSWGESFFANLTKLNLGFGTPSFKAGATAKSYKISFDSKTGTTSSMITDEVKASGSYTARLELTDSRGFTTTKEQSFTFVDYSVPTVTPGVIERCDEDGNLQDDGTRIKIDADFTYDQVDGNNSATYKILYKESSATSFTELESAELSSANESIETITEGLFEEQKSYNIRLQITDGAKTVSVDKTILSAFCIVDIKKGGKGIAIGKAATKDGFECDMETWFNKKVHFSEEMQKAIGLMAYPVGAYYFSENSTSPKTLFGGEWEQVTGKFLRMDNGTGTGGKDSVTLSVENMPSHNHTFTGTAASHSHTPYFANKGNVAGGRARYYRSDASAGSRWDVVSYDSAGGTCNLDISSTSITPAGTIGNKGGGQAFDNKPAYKNVYAWRRTA